MPALIQSVGRLARRGLLHEPEDPPLVVGGDHAEGRRVVDPGEGDRGLGLPLLVEAHQGGDVEVGEDVAVADQEPAGHAAGLGGEADGAGGAEGLGLGRHLDRRGRRTTARRRRRTGSRATARPR